jgi:hypothetical protein
MSICREKSATPHIQVPKLGFPRESDHENLPGFACCDGLRSFLGKRLRSDGDGANSGSHHDIYAPPGSGGAPMTDCVGKTTTATTNQMAILAPCSQNVITANQKTAPTLIAMDITDANAGRIAQPRPAQYCRSPPYSCGSSARQQATSHLSRPWLLLHSAQGW